MVRKLNPIQELHLGLEFPATAGPSGYNVAPELQEGLPMPLPQTEIPGRLQAELMSRGLRMTRQRRTILSVVETAKQHLDASQLLRRARRLDPQIDRVTVYRTLGLLKRHGLIDELDLMHMQGEKHYYERRPQRDHIHMACLRCGKITEFESDLFDRLKGQIQRDCRFHIVVTRLEVGGYCAECRTTDQPKD
jgi:Fur family ferric uptake transcriptional regulator